MLIVQPGAQVVRQQLERMLESSLFTRSAQLSRLLRYLVEKNLEGRDQELKESVIGVEVFGRDPGYDPKLDPIVRTEARRLRARLTEYYEGEGLADMVRIDLPKGGYVPQLHVAEDPPAKVTPGTEGALSLPSKWRVIGLAAAGLVFVLAVVGVTRSGVRPPPKNNSPAYDLYLRARDFEMQPKVSGVQISIDLFEQAIKKDPSFAPAYAGIAAGSAARSGFDEFDAAQRADMMARGWAAAEKAVRLDPQSADSQEGLAMMQARAAQWERAERSFRRAIGLEPREVLWRQHFAMFLLLPLGRVEEAIRELRAAEELDPLSPQTHSLLTIAFRSAGRFDEAASHCDKGAQNDQLRGSCWAANFERQGKSDEAVRILEPIWSGHLLEPGAQALGVAYAKAGRRKDAERVATMLPRLASRTQIFAALGDKDRTFELLDQMVPMGPARIGRDFLISPNFAFLRDDPRLRTLKQKVGLPN
jgi:tetratricopeptide (TPR) repeat protein